MTRMPAELTSVEILTGGVLFGLGAAVPIGPVNVEIARRCLLRGWSSGVALGLGAVSVDMVYAVLSVVGVGVASRSPWVYWPVALGGTALLAYLGVMCIRGAVIAYRKGWRIEAVEGPAPRLWRVYTTGIAMTAINPMTLAFWFGGLASRAASSGIEGRGLGWLATGVFFGTFGWVLAFSTLMAVLGRWRKPWWLALADLAGGMALLAFAGIAAWSWLRRIVET